MSRDPLSMFNDQSQDNPSLRFSNEPEDSEDQSQWTRFKDQQSWDPLKRRAFGFFEAQNAFNLKYDDTVSFKEELCTTSFQDEEYNASLQGEGYTDVNMPAMFQKEMEPSSPSNKEKKEDGCNKWSQGLKGPSLMEKQTGAGGKKIGKGCPRYSENPVIVEVESEYSESNSEANSKKPSNPRVAEPNLTEHPRQNDTQYAPNLKSPHLLTPGPCVWPDNPEKLHLSNISFGSSVLNNPFKQKEDKLNSQKYTSNPSTFNNNNRYYNNMPETSTHLGFSGNRSYQSSNKNAFDAVQTDSPYQNKTKNSLEFSLTNLSLQRPDINGQLMNSFDNPVVFGIFSSPNEEITWKNGRSSKPFPNMTCSIVKNQETGEIKEVYQSKKSKRKRAKNTRAKKIEVTRKNNWKIGNNGAFKDIEVEIYYHFKAETVEIKGSSEKSEGVKRSEKRKSLDKKNMDYYSPDGKIFIKNLDKDLESPEKIFGQNDSKQSLEIKNASDVRIQTESKEESKSLIEAGEIEGLMNFENPQRMRQTNQKNSFLFNSYSQRLEGNSQTISSIKQLDPESIEPLPNSGFKAIPLMKPSEKENRQTNQLSSDSVSDRVCAPMQKDVYEENEPLLEKDPKQMDQTYEEKKWAHEHYMNNFYNEWERGLPKRLVRLYGFLSKQMALDENFLPCVLEASEECKEDMKIEKLLSDIIIQGIQLEQELPN